MTADAKGQKFSFTEHELARHRQPQCDCRSRRVDVVKDQGDSQR
jgi:hypothetical protein